MVGRECGELFGLPEAQLDDWRRERAGPAGGGAGEHERVRDRRMSVVELDRERASERHTGDVRFAQAERGDEAGEGVCIVPERKPLGRVG